ncbi:MAG: hypothetical protein V1875_02615 [Candidatus Altiarchaeota archaeon]
MNLKQQAKRALAAIMLSGAASATLTPIHAVPCAVIEAMWEAVRSVAPMIFAIMFLYGAARYVYSADDPGGRKQGKNIIIHAIIGVLIMGVLVAIVSIMTNLGDFPLCPGITIT